MNIFWKEIISQPETLKVALDNFIQNSEEELKSLRQVISANKISNFIFTGMGSSLFSCYIPYYLLNQEAIHTEIIEASQLLYYFSNDSEFNTKKFILFVVSQSGESGEIITLVRNISKTKKNLITVGISNTSESQLAENVDILFEIKAGTETSVTSKTFTNSLLILFLLSVYLVNNFSVPREIFNEVNDMIGYIKKLFKDLDTKLEMITKIISFFGGTPEFLEILSSGPSLATAFQAALIYKEITKNYSEAHITSSFYHGGIECLKEDSCLVLISSDEINFKLNVHLIKNMREWKVGKILHISNYNIETISDDFGFDVGNLIQDKKNVYSITHKITNPFLAPICEIVFLQLLFYKMAENEIIEPGKFRFSSKITKELK